jgi:hypothetical protein
MPRQLQQGYGRALYFRQKKPRWVGGGVRVIVVVANSVSATAIGLWWIIIFITVLILVMYSSSYDPLIFWLRCL